MRTMTLPPGPALPAAAQIALWAFRPISFLTSCAQRFGDTFTVRFPGYPPLVFTSDPAAVSEILAGDPGTFLTGQGNRILKPLLGEESLLLLDGEHHKQRRRLVMPPFHGPAMRAAADAMGAAARRHLERWPTGRPFPVQPAFAALTLDVIVETVIGVRENDRRAELCGRLTRLLSLGTHPSVFFFVGRGGEIRLSGMQRVLGPLSPIGVFVRRKRAVTALLREEIARRRQDPSPGKDVLSLLLDLSDVELHDELMTLLVAGHETTATALAWTLYRLSMHADVLDRATEEARTGEETRYLDAVVLETMRLHPVVPMVVRRLAEARTIAGRSLPSGIVVAPNIWLSQRRPDVWPDPERFLPERFLGDAPRPNNFFPFGGGNRTCVGRVFALQEMRIVLREILRQRRPVAEPGYVPRVVRRGVTFAPSRGMPVRLEAQ